MLPKQRLREWMLLMFISAACSAPLDEQKIYFPGENPDGELETRNYGSVENLQSQQVQQPTYENMRKESAAGYPTYQQVEQIPNLEVEGAAPQDVAYTSHLIPNLQHQPLPPGFAFGQIPSTAGVSNAEIIHSNLPGHLYRQMYGEQGAQVSGYGGQLQGAVQHQSVIQHSSQSDGAHTFIQTNPETYAGLGKNGTPNSKHKVTEQKWTHFSTTGTGQIPHDEKQRVQQQGIDHQGYLGQNLGQDQIRHSHGSNILEQLSAPHASDLSAILDEAQMKHGHELHPSIKNAIDNVARELENTSLNTQRKPTHHTIHKISHIKKTRVQNIGREPSNIQSTSGNDNINLSNLITQLQMLEESPRHVNITWCEEKIKEFLRALRRKQDSGIYINEHVQEQTLHQILTQEAVQNTGSYDGVNEAPMTKVTIRPLGREHSIKSEETSSFIVHEQQNHGHIMNMQNQTQEEESSNINEGAVPELQEIITVIPDQGMVKQPEIMSHQHESPREPPPFTSDNTSDLGELELELPEYSKDSIPDTPIKHTHTEDVEAFENNNHRVTRPLYPFPQTEEVANGQQQETTFEEALQPNGTPAHSEASKYQIEHGTIYQESLSNIHGGNQINYNHVESNPQESGPAYTTGTQQNISGQEQNKNSFHHHINTPEGTEHEVSDDLDLQLPDYHPIPEHSHYLNTPEGTEHEVSDDLDLQLPEYHPISEQSSTGNGFQSHSSEQQQSNYKYEMSPVDDGYKQDSLTGQEKNEEGEIPTHYDSQQSGNHVNHAYVESVEETHHHIVHGRPSAPVQSADGTSEFSEEIRKESTEHSPSQEQDSSELKVIGDHKIARNESQQGMHSAEDHRHVQEATGSIHNLQQQQLNYDTLIEELIQLESLPGHQAIDKCEEKIQEFLEILKYQQEQGFGRNQFELQRLHQTLIEQAERQNKELSNSGEGVGGSTLPPTSFWRKVQKKIKKTYESAKDRAKQVIG